MSNVEKHERMAIMEAAISSSLSHPNIVQTYTYSMKPIKEDITGSAGSLNFSTATLKKDKLKQGTAEQGDHNALVSQNETGAKLHRTGFATVGSEHSLTVYSGFEVQLVLEYCNFGSLQHALQKGVFFDDPQDRDAEGAMTAPSSNYLAVLEIASDVAKGMLHLHAQNVIHSDLKVEHVQ
jgi:serine/threonine protein kinase